MKDLKEQIIKLLIKNTSEKVILAEGLKYHSASKEIESLINENYYPKEFVEWMLNNVYFRTGSKKLWLTNDTYFETMDELYTYYYLATKF